MNNLKRLLQALPEAERMGGSLLLKNMPQADQSDLAGVAWEAREDAVDGIRAIGSLLFWAETAEDAPARQDYITGVGFTLQILADVIDTCTEFRTAREITKSLEEKGRG